MVITSARTVNFLAAVIFILLSGIAYRIVARRLGLCPERVSASRGTLRQLPLRIGGWVGQEEVLDEFVVRAADADDYVARVYRREEDGALVGLWIAFGIRARDLMPHRPEVCYPGAGWTLQEQGTTVLKAGSAFDLPVRVLTFTPGGLDSRHLTVLNYYVVDDAPCEDVSLLRSKAWRGQTAINYMAQVQVTYRANPANALVHPKDIVCNFARLSYPYIHRLLYKNIATDSGG
jgi:EpsI family protein